MRVAEAAVAAAAQHEALTGHDEIGDHRLVAGEAIDAAVEAEKLLEQKTRKIAATAEHQIHCAPFKSILIAAGAGAAVATLVSWLIRSRTH